jgi:hypothetical protein
MSGLLVRLAVAPVNCAWPVPLKAEPLNWWFPPEKLTAELVAMMTAQRSYQANVQTIKTQDQAVQALVNLR